ncbi:MAG: metallophosphoesterase family protein [Candidatus Bipolaricaulota bacterium]
MKVLVVSDAVSPVVYEEKAHKRFAEVEMVFSCGDLPYDYLEFIVTALNVPLLYVHGNHDRPLMTDGSDLAAPRGCVNVHRRVVGAKGLLVGGLEGSPRYRPGARFQYTDREVRHNMLRMTPSLLANKILRGRALDVLLTHAPPRGIHDHSDHAHQGFPSLLGFLKRFKPRYLIHGHTYPHRGSTSHSTYLDTQIIQVQGHAVVELELWDSVED